MSSGKPGPHPAPPRDLDAREPLIQTTGQPWFRIHGLSRDPVHFGNSGIFRFDAPRGEFGVMYMGGDAHCAFIETFGQQTGHRVVTTAALVKRGLAEITSSRALRPVDLAASGGLARIGADARLIAGEHAVARRWSAALRAHPARPDGILYPARHDPARTACALFDHCRVLVTATPLGSLGDPAHSRLLGEILDTYGFALIDG